MHTDSVAEKLQETKNLIVAFASLEGDIVDQHFGSSQGFYVYEVDCDKAKLVTQKVFAREARDGNEDKLRPKLRWLVGSDVVYCGSIGGSASRQLVNLGITPIKVSGGPDIDDLIQQIQRQLMGEAEFWLSNILNKKARKSRTSIGFDEDDDGLWD